MNSENVLLQEINEFKLLISGLSKIPDFPSELLELINIRAENIVKLVYSNFDTDSENKTVVSEVKETEFQDEISMIIETIQETGFSGTNRTFNDVLSQTARINDRVEPNKQADLSKMLTLNDRFRFQRIFYANDAQKMAQNLADMNQQGSLEEALNLFREICPLGEESECFPDFYSMLEKRFPQKKEDIL